MRLKQNDIHPGGRATLHPATIKPTKAMIKILLSAALLFAAIVPTAATLSTLDNDAHTATWAAYCSTYGVNPDDPTDDEINYFLDCWRGSTEEESKLTPEQNNAIN